MPNETLTGSNGSPTPITTTATAETVIDGNQTVESMARQMSQMRRARKAAGSNASSAGHNSARGTGPSDAVRGQNEHAPSSPQGIAPIKPETTPPSPTSNPSSTNPSDTPQSPQPSPASTETQAPTGSPQSESSIESLTLAPSDDGGDGSGDPPTGESPALPEQSDPPSDQEEIALGAGDLTGTELTESTVPDEIAAAIEAAKLPNGQKKLVGRIHELVDQRDAYRNRALSLQAELEETKAQALQKVNDPAKPSANGTPFDANPLVTKLNRELADIRGSLTWLSQNPEGGYVPDGKGGQIEIDPGRARELRQQLEDRRVELAAEKSATVAQLRSQFEQARVEYHAKAVKTYPWLANQRSQEYQTAQNVLAVIPEIKERMPGWELLVGDLVTAVMARTKPKAITANVPPKRPGPSVPTAIVTAPTAAQPKVMDPGARALKEAEERFQESGTPDALKQLFVARRKTAKVNASR